MTLPIYTGNIPNRLTGAETFSADVDYYHAYFTPFVAQFNADIAALNLNSINDTSASSVVIGTGIKSFTVSASKSFAAGMWLSIVDAASPTTNSMIAQVISYSGTSLMVNVPANGVRGSGTKTAWVISLTAAPSTEIAATFLPVTTAANLTDSRAALDVYSTSDANTAIAASSASVGGIRNRIINGAMRISQEFGTTSTTITAGAALKWVTDGFYVACTGANVTAQQVITNNHARLVITGAAANTGVIIGTRMESADTEDMAGFFATISLLIQSSTLTTVNYGLYYANSKDTFGSIASPNRTTIQTGSLTGITSTEQLKSVITSAALDAGAHTGLELVITTGALLGSQTLTITNVQLEKGSIANPSFENLGEAAYSHRCERLFVAGSLLPFTATVNASTNLSIPLPMRVRMRVPPSVPTLTSITSNEGTTYTPSSNTGQAQVTWVCPTAGNASISFNYQLDSRLST